MYNWLLICRIQSLDRVQNFMSEQQSEIIRNHLHIYHSEGHDLVLCIFSIISLCPCCSLCRHRASLVLLSQSSLSVQGFMRDSDEALTHFAGSPSSSSSRQTFFSGPLLSSHHFTDYPESPQRIRHAIFTAKPELCTGHTRAPDRHKKQDGCLIMQSFVKGQDTGGEVRWHSADYWAPVARSHVCPAGWLDMAEC